jgi:hypothetical protein
MRKPKVIHISGRRWFNRAKGHSYYSVTVWTDDGLAGQTNCAHGYDGQYRESAKEILINKGYLKGIDAHTSLWRYCCAHKIRFVDECVDVQRRKDL